MVEDVDPKEFVTKEDVQALLKKELENLTMKNLIKRVSEDELGTFNAGITKSKKYLDVKTNANESTELQHLIGSWETLDAFPEDVTDPPSSRLDSVADSLLDVRVAKLKTKEESLPKKEKLRYTGDDEIRRNRFDLYFCYVVYFTSVFLAFAFAMYVWKPILRGIVYGKPARNITYYRQGRYPY